MGRSRNPYVPSLCGPSGYEPEGGAGSGWGEVDLEGGGGLEVLKV